MDEQFPFTIDFENANETPGDTVTSTTDTSYLTFVDDPDQDGVTYSSPDNCPLVNNPWQEDYDNDLLGDICDNCQYNRNPDQLDSNEDGIGDACTFSCETVTDVPQVQCEALVALYNSTNGDSRYAKDYRLGSGDIYSANTVCDRYGVYCYE